MTGDVNSIHGGGIDVPDDDTWTPAHYAAFYGHSQVLARLFQLSANPNSCNLNLCTPLHFAAGRGNLECCRVLLEYGANPTLLDEDRMSPSARSRELQPPNWSAAALILDLCKYLRPLPQGQWPGVPSFVARSPLRLEALCLRPLEMHG